MKDLRAAEAYLATWRPLEPRVIPSYVLANDATARLSEIPVINAQNAGQMAVAGLSNLADVRRQSLANESAEKIAALNRKPTFLERLQALNGLSRNLGGGRSELRKAIGQGLLASSGGSSDGLGGAAGALQTIYGMQGDNNRFSNAGVDAFSGQIIDTASKLSSPFSPTAAEVTLPGAPELPGSPELPPPATVEPVAYAPRPQPAAAPGAAPSQQKPQGGANTGSNPVPSLDANAWMDSQLKLLGLRS